MCGGGGGGVRVCMTNNVEGCMTSFMDGPIVGIGMKIYNNN